MIHWAAIGMFFKATSWPLGFYVLAKGASKLYFWTAVVFEAVVLLINIIGYKLAGLTGLGISYTLGYLISVSTAFIICKIMYKFSFDNSVIYIFCIQFLLAVCSFAVIKLLGAPYTYLVGVALIGISVVYSYRELDKRLDIKSIFESLKNRF
jgi:O-antigen/teichoic acid export membrane protein